MSSTAMMTLGTFITMKLNKKIINKHLLIFGISSSVVLIGIMFISCENWIGLSANYVIH